MFRGRHTGPLLHICSRTPVNPIRVQYTRFWIQLNIFWIGLTLFCVPSTTLRKNDSKFDSMFNLSCHIVNFLHPTQRGNHYCKPFKRN